MTDEQQILKQFSGTIDRVLLIDLVQSACLADAGRDILVESTSGRGIIRVRSEQTVYSSTGDLSGEAALKEILLWPGGSFRSDPASGETEENIKRTWEQLLIDSVQYRAERGFMESPGAESEFSGTINHIGLTDLIQLACMSPVERVLRIETPAVKGIVCFRQARVFHSECGDLSGESAFLELILSENGTFASTPLDGSEPATIDKPLIHLLVGAMAHRKDAGEMQSLDEKELTLSQKIQRMKMAEKIKAAISGNQETRGILMRDNNRMVQLAVINNPRLTEAEVAIIAANKQVDEEVLRRIIASREWMRLHQVRSALVRNPKCPLQIATRLLSTLNPVDLRSLAISKSVPSAVSVAARRLVKK